MRGPGMSAAVSHVTFTRFNDLAGASKKEFRKTWAEFTGDIENAHQYENKAACPLIKLATFGEQRTANNSLRHDANVLTVSGLEGDYDDGVVTIDEAAEKLVFAGVTAMFYTSPSHTDQAPRWRVVCPLSREYPPAERRRFVARLNGVLGGILAPESFALSQVYYIGRVNGSPYATRSVDGLCIDVIDELDGIAIDNAPKEGKPRGEKAREARDADPVIARLRERGMVKRDRQDGGVDIVCPFESSHTAPGGDGATTYFAAHTGGFARGHFVCKHSHCARRTDADFLAALGLAYEQAQPKADSPVDPEVAKLAALPPLEYDRVRKDKAIELGVRPGALDEEMKRQRKQEKAKKQKAARDGNGAAGAAILDSTTDTLLDLNQDNVALVFTRRYANQFRYSHDRKQWYSWDGTRWREETTRLAFDYTRNLSRTLNTDGKREVSRSSFCEGVEKYAQSDRVFALRGRVGPKLMAA